MQTNFNSRPSARGDERKKGKQASAGISIHAPPRGATRCDFSPFKLCSISIHAPPRGATSSRTQSVRCSFRFQFTPLREGRLGLVMPRMPSLLFQFTPLREGRRDGGGTGHQRHPISIHAPPRGATCRCTPAASGLRFQFTPLREGRRAAVPRRGAGTQDFNSRPSARGDVRH